MTGSLGDQINAATRSLHTRLNQSIIQFLPLALPPNASSHRLYALGLSHFYPVYLVFEAFFQEYLISDVLSPRIANVLKRLHLPGLERTSALERDIKLLLPASSGGPEAGTVPCLETFKGHAQLSLSRKPHLLFAYTWIFYMALFSGGRYIRSKVRAGLASSIASLPSADAEFEAAHTGLSFWDFPGELDGEDLKREYKDRVAVLSTELTEEERVDVVAEGISIMTHLIDVVHEIGEIVPSHAVSLALKAPSLDDRTVFQAPIASREPPRNSLVRNYFSIPFRDVLFAALELVASRAPEQEVVKPLPVQSLS
ncbi:MAG: hypothetical protein Q9216_004413 [Gyalolechia sp. 2 TL-2023]